MESRQQSDEPIPPTPAESSVLPEQRHAPETRPMPPASPPQTAGATRRRGTSKLRLVLAVLAGMLALLCLGGAGVAFLLYDQATKPNRSAPDVVVDNYLRAYLVDRNDAAASQYVCGDASLQEIESFRADTQGREKQHSMQVNMSWGGLAVQNQGDRASVTVDVRRTVSDGSERDVSTWQFQVVDDGGWRVCQAHRLN